MLIVSIVLVQCRPLFDVFVHVLVNLGGFKICYNKFYLVSKLYCFKIKVEKNNLILN